MRSSKVAASGIAAFALFAATANAGGSFTGNVCGLLTAKQVATVVAAGKCTREPKVSLAGAADYHGYWGANPASPKLPYLSFQINTGPSAYMQRAKTTLPQAVLIAGPPVKATGIGSLAYEAAGPTREAVSFLAGEYICTIVVQKPKTKSLAALNKVARVVAAKL